MTKQTAYIGLGSNLQDPITQLKQALTALAELPTTMLLKTSSFYASDSLLPDQPHYINAIACLQTNLSAEALLDELQQIENNQGRIRKHRWGARTLDLDIILYGDQQLNTSRLTIPHSQLAVRSFVLVPLLEIAPHSTLPNGQTIASLLAHCPSQNLQKLD